MNQELWNNIEAFDLDDPPAEYGFSIRLSHENFWTREFTTQAIVEYKKFMYLAATSDFMVSPSAIVDTVWHQHLIFTQSYQDFCTVLGKHIQHVPSTHNREEVEKFKQAKERTTKYYERDFGKQPKDIWEYNDMFESLNLGKAKYNLRTFILLGILGFVCLTVPAYFILKPIYREIENPNFVFWLFAGAVVTFLLLEVYNKFKLKQIVSQADETSFVNHLHPFELVYLKTQKLSHVVNGAVNELIHDGTIRVNSDHSIELAEDKPTLNMDHLNVIAGLKSLGKTHYPNLLKMLATKPIFTNIPKGMDAFRKYFNKSKKFGTLFYTNFAVLAVLVLLGFTRIVTGVLYDKPVVIIVIVTLLLIIAMAAFLNRLTKQITRTTIPNLYKQDILPKRQIEDDWQWSYFLLGTAVLTTAFVPLATYVDRNNSSGSSCGSSCGTSCGSSCGSSCGGCGGCGGD